MPDGLYACLQDEDKIAIFTMDRHTGQLTPTAEMAAVGGPSVLAISPDRRTLYIGQRTGPAISSYRIDQATGGLTPVGTVSQAHAPTFLAPDRSGKYLLCAYYQGGGAAVYHLGPDGTVGAPSQEWLATDTGAHAIATDPSNRFAFVPHIARVQDNVLEPPKNIPGPNVIMQFRFDAGSGRLAANTPARISSNRDSCRAAALLLSSEPRSRLFLKRAGLQRHRLSAGPRQRHARRGADDLHAAGRLHH